MNRLETATSAGFQKGYLDRFKGNSEPATKEDLATVYASLIGVVDIFLSTHRAVIGLPLSLEQRALLQGATQDMEVLIRTVGVGIDKLDGKLDAE